MIKINKNVIKKFDPCSNGWKNYLIHYEKWEGTILEFLYLDHVPSEDKIWLFSRNWNNEEMEIIQRKFAVACAFSCDTDVKEVVDFRKLILDIYEANSWRMFEETAAYTAAYDAADKVAYDAADDADRAAYNTAYRAAYNTAYRAAYNAAYDAADRAAYDAAKYDEILCYAIMLLEG